MDRRSLERLDDMASFAAHFLELERPIPLPLQHFSLSNSLSEIIGSRVKTWLYLDMINQVTQLANGGRGH
jgi:hypothetical protein